MIDAFYVQTARVEEHHWWFVHRREILELLVERHAPGPYRRALDLGCGTCGNAGLLAAMASFVVGLDRSALALDLGRAKATSSALVQGDALGLAGTFAPGSFDLVAVCNVLYHAWVGDVGRVLGDAREVLREGGCLVWTEPAFPILARRHDRVDLGIRRFRLGEVRRLLVTSGFEVRFASYFNAVAFVPALVVASVDRLRGRLVAPVEADEIVGEIEAPPRLIDRLIRRVCRTERAALARGWGIPLGVGIVAIAAVADQVRTKSIK